MADRPGPAQRRPVPRREGYAAESLLEMGHRAVRTVRRTTREVAAEHGPDAVWVAVPRRRDQGDPGRRGRRHLDQFQRILVDPASVSVVHYTQRRPFLVGANDMGSDLARLLPPPGA